MEQSSGQICVSVSWKAMKITGIDDRRYWNHIPSDESRLDLITTTIFILFPLCVLLISLSLYTLRNIFCHSSILHGFGFDFDLLVVGTCFRKPHPAILESRIFKILETILIGPVH